jgi:hypothetical protein
MGFFRSVPSGKEGTGTCPYRNRIAFIAPILFSLQYCDVIYEYIGDIDFAIGVFVVLNFQCFQFDCLLGVFRKH